MLVRLGTIAGLVLANLTAAAMVLVFQFQEQRNRAMVEVGAAHGELELALATLAVRMAGMATAIERASPLTPDAYAQIYRDAVRGTSRIPERAIALMAAFDDMAEAEAQVGQRADAYGDLGYPPFEVFPPGPAETVFPVIFVEPAASRANVFGYDIGTSPERLLAARTALATGAMSISEPVILSQDTDLSQVSFLLVYPVFLPATSPGTAAREAVLGAAMTPGALFERHIVLYEDHVVDIDLGIGGVTLPVTLAASTGLDGPRIPILRGMDLPDISINGQGFAISFRARVSYVPRASDLALPLGAALLTALVLGLLVRDYTARETGRRKLAQALAENEAKLRRAYEVQARSQRIEALGRLVGGVAHDFNNILSVILGNLELLKEEGRTLRNDPLVAEAVAATRRGAHLTRQLLSVGRKSHLQTRAVAVSDALRDSVRMLGRVLPATIEINTVSAAGLWPIAVDPDGLQNALLNLGLNARDAMEGRGKLTIEATNTRASQAYLDDRPDEDIAPGRYVMISVSDDGPGMAPEVAERAFEPFFTTKHATDGSGLGLPSVLGFCRQSGGTCRIYSEPGVGTSVKMYYPVSETPAGSADADPPADFGNPAAGRILLAEDEDSVAQVILRQLERAGYRVKRVPTGDQAWADLQAGAAFDLLISDLVMPGELQGAELARRVEAARPDIALLLISGYPQEAAIAGNGVATRHPVLTKPVPSSDLLATVRHLLSDRTAARGQT